MSLYYFNHDVDFPSINKETTTKWIKDIIVEFGFELGEINIIFCTDTYLLEINKQFLEHNYYTDIVTFNNNMENIINGELYISLERIQENADTYSVSYNNELMRVIIHGILHLLGFNDLTEREKAIMRKQENYCLNVLVKYGF